ncbi:MAG: hypothetical protein AAGM67_14910, partial [Bacteroidota bacterium]
LRERLDSLREWFSLFRDNKGNKFLLKSSVWLVVVLLFIILIINDIKIKSTLIQTQNVRE